VRLERDDDVEVLTRVGLHGVTLLPSMRRSALSMHARDAFLRSQPVALAATIYASRAHPGGATLNAAGT
jgi:hypothetical protein